MQRDQATIEDLIRAITLPMTFGYGMTKSEFLDDVKTQSAILHQLLVMGEAVKRLSMPFRERHPEIPWRDMAGMRDVLIHSYDIVDLDEV